MSRITLAVGDVASTLCASLAQAGVVNTGGFEVTAIQFSTTFRAAQTGVSVPENTYQDTVFGDNFPPSPSLIAEVPLLQFDSYVAFGGQPSSESNQAITPPSTPPGFGADSGFFDVPGQLTGAVFNDFVGENARGGETIGQSEPNPFNENEAFFFARLTIPAGSIVEGEIFVDLGFDGLQILPIETVDNTEPGNVDQPLELRGFREFRVFSRRTSRNVMLPTELVIGRGDTTLAPFDVYDLYIELIPAPGAGVGLVAMGLVGASRRRR